MSSPTIVPRPDVVDHILPYIDAPLVKVLTGVRRCGKSTVLAMVMDELRSRGVPNDHIIRYNFDSLEFDDLKTARALYGAIRERVAPRAADSATTYLFLDEIQEVEDWERVVNSLMADFDVDIYVTGSNSRMMSSEISTHLTGRYVTFRVFPLSFREFLAFRRAAGENAEEGAGDTRRALADYLRRGGFPATALGGFSVEEIYAIVRDIYNSTIFTDIVRRNQIRKVDQLERIVRYTFDNVGRTFSAAAIAKYLKSQRRAIDEETVYSYLDKLERAYILHRCRRYDLAGKEILKTQEKYYLADTSLRYAVLGYDPDSVAAMLENLVYLELLRRGWEVFVGKVGDAEIDFVATRRERRMYLQVSQAIGSAQTEEREYGRLLAIRDSHPKYVLRTDDFAAGGHDGIRTMHVADFLLSDEW
ncbi:ATP-binding protein [Bifidobacterium pullorum]|uniref:ATP-binding protein n=1 Tax=Bifidobacterium pullorum TaxID=78448 RepID=UPI001956C081|nr:ATP-binding protein [Bifidobacterium pullorum]